jgi:hypothetical protein
MSHDIAIKQGTIYFGDTCDLKCDLKYPAICILYFGEFSK